MPITERTLRQWRKDALKYPTSDDFALTKHGLEMAERILRLTQELMDMYLKNKQ